MSDQEIARRVAFLQRSLEEWENQGSSHRLLGTWHAIGRPIPPLSRTYCCADSTYRPIRAAALKTKCPLGF